MAATDAATERRDALVERLFEAVLGFNDLHTIYIGDRLGLYRAVADGAGTPAEAAQATGTDERYVREWLEHQAVTGILEAEDGHFRIPAGHDEVLLDRDSVNYMAQFIKLLASEWLPA